MTPKMSLELDQTIDDALDSYLQASNEFMAETTDKNYLIVVDESKSLIFKIRKLLYRYKDKISIVRVDSIEKSRQFIAEHNTSVQGILIEYSPSSIKQIPEEPTTIPTIMIVKDAFLTTGKNLLDINCTDGSKLATLLGI